LKALRWNILYVHLPLFKKKPAEKAGFAIGSPMILPIHIVSWVSGKATKHDHWFNATIIKIQFSIFIIAPINFGSLGIAVVDPRILGCVRAYARTHPKIRTIPR
jgi:hypothetical protein